MSSSDGLRSWKRNTSVSQQGVKQGRSSALRSNSNCSNSNWSLKLNKSNDMPINNNSSCFNNNSWKLKRSWQKFRNNPTLLHHLLLLHFLPHLLLLLLDPLLFHFLPLSTPLLQPHFHLLPLLLLFLYLPLHPPPKTAC